MSRITVELLRESDACEEGVRAFEVAYPDGLDYDPTSAAQAAELLAGPLAGHLGWAIDKGLIEPRRFTSGDYGTATVGDHGTATAGDYGTATVGYYGAASAGCGGMIAIRRHDGVRTRLVVGYVGEGGILADVPYRLDERGRFVEVAT